MDSRNGYFQFIIDSSGVSLKLYPPVGGGMPIDINELRGYMVDNGYTPDIVVLNKLISNLSGEMLYKLSDKEGYQIAESMVLRVTDDKMHAIARFYPHSNSGAAYSLDSIKNDLKHKGITGGIDEKVINEFLSDKHYCTDYTIANGSAPTESIDGSVKYHFNTEPNTRPALKEDGTADFHNLNTLSRVEKGQLLAELVPAVMGEPGINVCGEVIRPKEVKNTTLKYSNNISISEDNLKIFSMVDGHATLVDGKVFVSSEYIVPNIDTSTGNIEYDGNIIVEGNVSAGFSVKAKGDIVIKGVAEGAEIIAAGNIIIERGMNGMSKGVLRAGGNVVSKFLENVTVHANGYVYSEAILHSDVFAKGNVEVEGRRGMICGGTIRSLGCVNARVIGSTMGGNTDIEVGIDPEVKARILELQKSIPANSKMVSQAEAVITTLAKRLKNGENVTDEQKVYFKQLSMQYKLLKPQIEKDMEELDRLSDMMSNMVGNSYVKVSDFAYPGTVIRISDVYMVVKTITQHCRFVKDEADVRVVGF